MTPSDGIGKIVRVEPTPVVERHHFPEKTNRDKRGKNQGETKDEEPQDTVELHGEEGEEDTGPEPKPVKLPKPNDSSLDISA